MKKFFQLRKKISYLVCSFAPDFTKLNKQRILYGMIMFVHIKLLTVQSKKRFERNGYVYTSSTAPYTDGIGFPRRCKHSSTTS